MFKTCSICKIEQPIENFSKRSDRPSGVQSRCKNCHRVFRKEHLEQEKKTKAIYRSKNAEKINNYHVLYNRERDRGLYLKWVGMLKRVNDKSGKFAFCYTDRGIKNKWENYPEFRQDMLKSYLIHLDKYGKKQTSLDRIDNDGDYCKENCRWADWSTQNFNKRQYRRRGNHGKRKGRKFPKVSLMIQ